MRPSIAIIAALVLTLAAGCSSGKPDSAPQDGPRAEDVARSYSSLQLITKQPVLVDPGLAALCVGIWQQHVDKARKQSGPHAHTSIRIFMNDVAADNFHTSAKQYPVGSIIVKEKQGLPYQGKSQKNTHQYNAKTSDGVGGMIKRQPGFGPDNGDWEYFYFEDSSKVEHGKIASCIECHRGAAATDFVFGNWANDGLQVTTSGGATE